MRKLAYPALHSPERAALETAYWDEIFKSDYKDLQTEWIKLQPQLNALGGAPIYPTDIKSVIMANYDTLVDYYIHYRTHNYSGKKLINSALHDSLMKLFSYNSTKAHPAVIRAYQPALAHFFMRQSEALNLSVCHYCEMSYVNAYGIRNVFTSIGDFLLNGSESDLRYYVRSSGDSELSNRTINRIMRLQNGGYTETSIVPAFDRLFYRNGQTVSKSTRVWDTLRNHFDLDHFLPKSLCPLVGLSLYNFVPSCSVCNEKLKGADEMGGLSRSKLLVLSPTSDDYRFDEAVKIRLRPLKGHLLGHFAQHANNAKVDFVRSKYSVYSVEIQEYRLQERYAYHKCEAIRVHDVMVDYPPSRLKEIAKLVGGKTPAEVLEELIALNFPDNRPRVFEKLKKDVREQMVKVVK